MRTIVPPRFLASLASALLLLIGCLHAASAATHALLVEQVEQRLAQEYPDKPIVRVAFDKPHLNMVISKRIDARLLEDNPRIEAVDLQFTAPYQKHAVAVITLTYPSHAIALRQAGRLVALTHLQNTKILTYLSYGVSDETLVILFSERPGNDPLVALIKTFADMLKTAPTSQVPTS